VVPYFGVTQLTIPTELASTLENSTLFQKKPEYRKALQVVSVPERVIQFRVVWEDDKGQVRLHPLSCL
jgi:glutamate dehydrogenase (NADP+)